MLTAVKMGVAANMITKTAPVSASGAPTGLFCCTAPTVTPMATANTAGMTPLTASSAHQATASSGSAFGSAAKNCHSGLTRSRFSMHPTLPPTTDDHDASARGVLPQKR